MLRRIPPKNMEVPRALPVGLHKRDGKTSQPIFKKHIALRSPRGTIFAFSPKLKSLTFHDHLKYKIIMKFKSIFPVSITFLCLCIIAASALANDVFFDPQLQPYDGKAYIGAQDPQYISYDSILREYMAKRIQQEFGIELDLKKYSGFDLLEIESLLKCKKPEEPADTILKMFPKYR
jgi:hypothetical protein